MNESKFQVTRDFDLLENRCRTNVPTTEILTRLKDFLAASSFKTNARIDYVEHTSSNPCSDVHLGNLWSSVIGDFYCRGLNLDFNFYVNDLTRNFCKATVNKRLNPSVADTDVYALPCDQSLIDLERERAYNNTFSPIQQRQRLEFRSNILRIIRDTLERAGIQTRNLKYVYESDLIPRIKSLRNTPQCRYFTSNNLPLYIAGDYVYMCDVLSSHRNVLIVYGPDTVQHVKTLKKQVYSTTGRTWTSIFTPIIRFKNQKLSKRNGNVVSYDQLAERLGCPRNVFKTFFKLFVLKYINAPVVDLEDLLVQKQCLKLAEWICEVKQTPSVLDLEIEVDTNYEFLNKMCCIDKITTHVIESTNLNRLYKLIVHLKSYARSCTPDIKNPLLKKYFDLLGL